MGSGAAGQPMNSDDKSWPFTSPAGKDATKAPKPHEIDLYIEPSPRDSRVSQMRSRLLGASLPS